MPVNTFNKSPEHSFRMSSSILLPLNLAYSTNVARNWAKLSRDKIIKFGTVSMLTGRPRI